MIKTIMQLNSGYNFDLSLCRLFYILLSFGPIALIYNTTIIFWFKNLTFHEKTRKTLRRFRALY